MVATQKVTPREAVNTPPSSFLCAISGHSAQQGKKTGDRHEPKILKIFLNYMVQIPNRHIKILKIFNNIKNKINVPVNADVILRRKSVNWRVPRILNCRKII